MKILNLRFKNINSLKGEWEIAFDQYPLADAAVFAITGPNGSGKTSILDSISLALYGETFRLNQPAEHIMTRDTTDCYSEVTFSLGKESYRSRWNFQRSEGQGGATAMELTHLNGDEEVLETRVKGVRSRVTALTGLDFKRFTRSIMLAQGDFAAFLNALDTERAEILEKITGTDVYAEYFERLDQEVDKAHKQLLRIKQEIADIPLMDAEQLKALEGDVVEIQEQVDDQTAVMEDLTKQNDWLKALARLQQEIGRDQMSLADAEQRKIAREADLARVDAAHKAVDHKAELEVFDDKRREVVKALAVIESMQKEAASVHGQLSELDKTRADIQHEMDQLQQAITGHELKKQLKTYQAERKKTQRSASQLEGTIGKQQKAQAKIAKWLSKHDKDQWLAQAFAEVGYQLTRLKMAKDRRALATSRYEASAQSCKQELSAITKINASIARLQGKSARLNALKNNKEKQITAICGGASLQALEDRYEQANTSLDSYQQLVRIFQAYQGLRSELGKIRKKATRKEPTLQDVQQQYDALSDQCASEENIWRTLDTAVRNEAYIQHYNEDRPLLESGERCPLCGSYDHPFVTDGVPETDSRRALADQAKKLGAMRKKLDTLSARRARLDQTPSLSMTDQKINGLVMEWNNIRTMLALPQSELNKQAMEPVHREQHAIEMDRRHQANLIKEAVKFGQKIQALDQNIQIIDGEVAEERNRLNQLEVDLAQEQKALLQMEMELKAAREDEQGQQDALRTRLADDGITMPAKNGRFVQKLEAKTGLFRKQVQQQEALEQELATLTQQSRALGQALEQLEARRDEDTKRLQEIEAALAGQPRRRPKALNKALGAVALRRDGLLEQIGEVQRTVQEKEEQIKQKEIDMKLLRDQQTSVERTLLEKAAPDGFQTIEVLRGSLLSLSEQERIRADWEAVDSECQQLHSTLDATRKQFKMEQARQLSSQPLEALQWQLEQADEHYKQLREQLAHAEAVLQEQHDHRTNHEQMQQVFEQQEAECARLDEEKQAMDAETEPVRRKHVQGMLFDRLLELSNRHLEKISGRYYIRRGSENGFGLLIEDTVQAGVFRAIRTLSGGESFVVSLALALGLSDIANNGTRIDSLFLDEGLASLDEETLYMVLATLEDLHKNGKTVGVISHVKELKEKIHTQIRAVKLQGGISRLEVIP